MATSIADAMALLPVARPSPPSGTTPASPPPPTARSSRGWDIFFDHNLQQLACLGAAQPHRRGRKPLLLWLGKLGRISQPFFQRRDPRLLLPELSLELVTCGPPAAGIMHRQLHLLRVIVERSRSQRL
jgi:hypothetical protein